MKARALLLVGAVAALSGCNQGAETNSANQVANAAEASPKHPSYCFFKDADTKDWKASRGADGNITVKGRAYVEDTRYQAALSEQEMSGVNASLWLTMGPNSGAYGAPENWWDVSAAIPNSGAVESVTVMCGNKTVAQLKVPSAH
jgi:hypothetical protein